MSALEERDIDALFAILDHCDKISKCVQRFGDDFETFLRDDVYQDAVLMNILQIGEIAHRLSERCRNEIDSIPWERIYGQRNIIVHGYTQISEETIWDTVKHSIPELADIIISKLHDLGEL